VLLLIPLGLLWLKDLWDHHDRKTLLRVLWLALPPAGVVLYAAFNWWYFGNPLAFSAAQVNWHRSFDLPWESLRWAWIFSQEPMTFYILPANGFLECAFALNPHHYDLAFTVFGIGCLLIGAFRLPPHYTLYLAASLLVPMFSPADGEPLLSMPRFVMTMLPIYVLLGRSVDRRCGGVAIAGSSCCCSDVLARFVTWYWTA